jgi:hypothetical protein
MQDILNEAAEMVLRQDESYAQQLSDLIKSNPSATILAMM